MFLWSKSWWKLLYYWTVYAVLCSLLIDRVSELLWYSSRHIGYYRRVWCICFVIYVAGVILLHCVFFEYSAVMLLLTCVVRKILHYLRYMSVIWLLAPLSGAHFTNWAVKITQSAGGEKLLFCTQSLSSSGTEQIFSCPIQEIGRHREISRTGQWDCPRNGQFHRLHVTYS